MKLVVLESLGVSEEKMAALCKPFLEEGHEIVCYEKNTDPAVQIERLQDADAVLLANMPLLAEVIATAPKLRYIDIAFTGVDHVAVAKAKELGMTVSNAAGYSTEAVAELALCMMLSLLRFVPEMERRCRAGGTKDGLMGMELKGKTVGILGAGTIGLRVAELCHAFGCKVLGYRRHVTGNEPSFVQFVSMEELLTQSDIVSLHCPLNDSTRHLMGEAQFAKMKPGAILINTARGPVVDSQALAKALHSGHLAAAGIDVFDVEPPLATDDVLLTAPNVLATPHIAFASKEAMEIRAEIVFENFRQWLAGTPVNLV